MNSRDPVDAAGVRWDFALRVDGRLETVDLSSIEAQPDGVEFGDPTGD